MTTHPPTARLVNVYRLSPPLADGTRLRSYGVSGYVEEAVRIAQAHPGAWPMIEAVDVHTGESWFMPTPT